MTRREIFDYALDRYGAEPEYLWASAPNYAVLRRRDNKKWFAIVMDLPLGKLGLDSDAVADILDLRCGPELVGALLSQPGYFPAWHMNKQNWVTAVLDAVPGEDLLTLLEVSYDLAAGGKRRRPGCGRNREIGIC